MPSLLIKTNGRVAVESKPEIMGEMSRAVAQITGKPESFVLVAFEQCDMMFGGSTEPCAYMVRTISMSHRKNHRLV